MTMEEYDSRYNPDPTPLIRIVILVFTGILLCALVSLFTGCTTTRYIEVPQVHTEYVHTTDTLIHRDSIYQRDSIYVVQRGDTVFHNTYKVLYKDRLVYSTHTDTLQKTDTVTVAKVEYIEKKQNVLQRMAQHLGVVSALLIVIGAVVLVVRKKFV